MEQRSSHATLSRRTFVAAALGLGVSPLLAACQGSSSSSSNATTSDTYFDVAIQRPESIDPFAADAAGLAVVEQLFEPLTSYDYATGELVGLAAQSYEVSDDALTVTFHLRQGRTFHNGETVTAASFKRAWERLLNPASAASAALGTSPHAWRLALVAGYADLVAGTADELSGVACPDDETLTVTLSEPYADFPYVVAHPALAPVPASAEEDVAAFGSTPVGNGPYIMDGSIGSNSTAIRIQAWSDYAGEVPQIERVRFSMYDDGESAYQDYLTGAIDVAPCPVDELESAIARYGQSSDGITASADQRLVSAAGLSTNYLVCNTTSAPCDDADFRRALSLAIDRSTLAETIYRDTQLAADGVVPPAVRGYREGAWPYATFDTEQAEDLLDALYPLDEDDERDVAVSIIYASKGGSKAAMEELVDEFEAVGLTCEAEGLDYDTFYERLETGDFTLARLNMVTDEPVLERVLFPLFHTRSVGGANLSGYTNDEASELITEARATVDENARISLLQQAEDLIAEDTPVIPLTYPAHAYVVSSSAEELVIDPDEGLHLDTATPE